MSDTTNHEQHFNSENHTNELADGELDERDLEAINGGGESPNQKITASSLIDVVTAPPIPYGGKGVGRSSGGGIGGGSRARGPS